MRTTRTRLIVGLALLLALTAPAARAHAQGPGITIRSDIGLSGPEGVAVDARGNIFVADTNNDRIVKLSSSGHVLATWSVEDFSAPANIAVDRGGNVYVLDTENATVYKFSNNGELITSWPVASPYTEAAPVALAIGGHDNVFVADSDDDEIYKYAPDGSLLDAWDLATMDGDGLTPALLAVGRSGKVYVTGAPDGAAPAAGSLVEKLTSNGTLLAQWASPARGIVVGGRGNLLVTAQATIQKYSSTGRLLNQWGSYGSGFGQLINPDGLAVGGRGNIFVADTGNDRIQKLSATGQVLSIFR
jgi:sugar lactone lactonase YvrE